MHIVIVGGGTIGLAVAWQSLRRGLAVTVIDPAPGSQASYASAGLLPGAAEMLYGQDDLTALCMASRRRYPSFVAEVEADAGVCADYRRDGLLDVAFDSAGLSVLDGLRSFQEKLGVPVRQLTAAECRAHEPMLAPSVRGGLLSPDDGAVDPRRLNAALLAAIDARGGTLIRERVLEVMVDGRAHGVRLSGGRVVLGDRTVLAAGCWTHELGGLPPGVIPTIRPGKGQILRLRSAVPFLRRATRAISGGSAIYLVPRPDGQLVVGATYEDRGYDTTVTAGGLWRLLTKVRAVLPQVDELELDEAVAGLRPGSPDGLPILGETAVPDLLLASGHSRIGIQLAPVTAEVIAELLVSGKLPDVAAPFAPSRFTREPVSGTLQGPS